MSRRLIVLDEAEEELIEAEKWYERQRPGLGREFRTAIDDGMELFIEQRELFVAFRDFPWFKDASIGAITKVELPSPHHLYWPELDVDLAVESIEHPEKFPLVSQALAADERVGEDPWQAAAAISAPAAEARPLGAGRVAGRGWWRVPFARILGLSSSRRCRRLVRRYNHSEAQPPDAGASPGYCQR